MSFSLDGFCIDLVRERRNDRIKRARVGKLGVVNPINCSGDRSRKYLHFDGVGFGADRSHLDGVLQASDARPDEIGGSPLLGGRMLGEKGAEFLGRSGEIDGVVRFPHGQRSVCERSWRFFVDIRESVPGHFHPETTGKINGNDKNDPSCGLPEDTEPPEMGGPGRGELFCDRILHSSVG